MILAVIIYAIFIRNVSVHIYLDQEAVTLSQGTAGLPVNVADTGLFDTADKEVKKIPPPDSKKEANQPAANKTVAPTLKKPPNKVQPVQKDQTANHFSNVAFILRPDLIRKTPAAVVTEKMGICEKYARRFSTIAIAERKQYGIPASITLAQGILESDAGGSGLSRRNNNHFGVKCFSRRCKRGHCSNFTDDTHKDFFRIYNSAWESYRDHSKFLQNNRYKHLKKLGTRDYKGWAYGLRKAGYATDKRYAEKLILIIETLSLYEYDL